jgi:cell division transport system permease protein
MVLVSLVFSLTIIGLWGCVLIVGDQLQTSIKENISVQVYLQKELDADSIGKIQALVANRPYVLKKEGKPSVVYISRDESAKKFIEETGENFADFMGENPLRDALIVNIAPSFSKKEQLAKIKTDLSEQSGIFEVVYTESLAEAIHHNIQRLRYAAIGFSVIVSLVILLLIMNTIRLAMYSQRFLIRSMQLVGATSWFIQKPYLFRSLKLGLLAGLLASGFIFAIIHNTQSYFPEITAFSFQKNALSLMGGIVVGGGILCLLSSTIAVNRFLGKSLEDLY